MALPSTGMTLDARRCRVELGGLPTPDDRGRGGAVLLGMVREAGATGRAGYDVELTVTIEEYE